MSWHPTLSWIDRQPDRPQDRPRPVTAEQRRVAAMNAKAALGTFDCWCGLPRPHDWPGKAAGAAHPRREAVS